MKISNDLDQLDQELDNDAPKQTGGAKRTSKFGAPGGGNNGNSNQPKKPKFNGKLPRWIWLVVAALIVIGGAVIANKRNAKPDKPKTAQVDKNKKQDQKIAELKKQRQEALEKKKEEDAKKQAQEDAKAKKLAEKNKKDAKKHHFKDGRPAIKALFTAMDVYDDAKESQKDIANKMLKYANRDVVMQLMPTAFAKDKGQASFRTVGKFYKPLQITNDPSGAKGVYNVGVWRSVSAGNHTSKYNDSYTVTTNAKGKVVDVQARTSTIE